ncbi:MAG TPA: hypothetical protein DEB09_05085 [Candidatus Magasanikbacteria bacterium]|nr:hypothetical protein [Candidatus Magasanikbacteria bacterium]
MKTIIIGAGRGKRLEHLTNTEPKTFTRVHNKRILDWILEAHQAKELRDIVFIGGYLIDVVRKQYPYFTFRHNTNWENNNILKSLFYAINDMGDGFICSYSDILYKPEIVKKLLASPADITIAVDTDWRARYVHRSLHPSIDAEKVTADGELITTLSRTIPDDLATGEFIGLAKFSRAGAKIFKEYFCNLPKNFQFEKNIPLNRAYLLHYLNYLVQQGVKINFVTTHGDYIEIDTLEDYAYAQKFWKPASQLFPASVVGSLPRPQFVQDVILNEGDPFSPILDKAVAYAIALQEQAGLDVISDGEWRRKSYVGVIANIASGFKHYFNSSDGRSWHTVEEKLVYDKPGFFAREAKFLKLHTIKKIKVCLPSPYLLGQRLWDEKKSIKAYPTREAFVEALIPILRNEIILLREAGANIVQIDDPHICLFVDKELRTQFSDPKKELNYACQVVNEVVKGIDGIETALHLCRRNKGRQGWIGKGGYEAIISAISAIDVDQFVLEYSIPVAGDFSALKNLPEKFKVGLGCVECRFEHIDTPEEIVTRVEKALQYVAPNRIILNPDCGFAPGSQANVPLDEAYLKLKNEVGAGKILRKKYS